MADLKPTEEQANIVDLVQNTDDNILVNALAGTGKTSTLELIQAASKTQPILCLAFNKKIAQEMEERFISTTTVRTFNGLGHRIWMKTQAKNLSLDPKKMQNLFKEHVKDLTKSAQRAAWDVYFETLAAIAMAKSVGYIPEGKFPQATRLITQEAFYDSLDEQPTSLCKDLIDDLLTASIKTAYEGFIDFNDQVYMSALFGGSFPRFPLVLVDEDQDLSPTNHQMLNKLVRGRIIAVGDRFQSIYAFRGVKQRGVEALQEAFSMTEADLSVSFRCPQKIVEAARWRVPHFKWIKPGGIAGGLRNPTLLGLADNSAIICRNNAPLFKLALNLLAAGRSVSVSGSDVGPKIISILRKLGDGEMNKSALLSEIESWRESHLAKSSTSANDIADCMKVFAAYGHSLAQAISYAEHLFQQKGTIRLLTGHKAKGLEFPVVYHLDSWLIGDGEQELNLRYVIQTRAMNSYYEITSKEIR